MPFRLNCAAHTSTPFITRTVKSCQRTPNQTYKRWGLHKVVRERVWRRNIARAMEEIRCQLLDAYDPVGGIDYVASAVVVDKKVKIARVSTGDVYEGVCHLEWSWCTGDSTDTHPGQAL